MSRPRKKIQQDNKKRKKLRIKFKRTLDKLPFSAVLVEILTMCTRFIDTFWPNVDDNKEQVQPAVRETDTDTSGGRLEARVQQRSICNLCERIYNWFWPYEEISDHGPDTRTRHTRRHETAVGSKNTLPQDDRFVFFWKENDIFSQWHPSAFKVDDLYFTCAEQYMMYMKADTFGDEWTKQQVMEANHPRTMKALCRKLTGRGYNRWNTICQEVVKAGNIAKFSQNKSMKEVLFSTYPKILVEASPHDTKWGIGLDMRDPRAHDERQWKGQNLLGYILTEVRDELMHSEGRLSEERRMNPSPEQQGADQWGIMYHDERRTI